MNYQNDQYSVMSTHKALSARMTEYINTVYLGENDYLREACSGELNEKQFLSQEPFIEANQAYKTVYSGIANSKRIPDYAKSLLREMSDSGLGVYPDPYMHQIIALENYFAGKDLLVATGTGSGKTECFLWPMVSKVVGEACNSPKTWAHRGVRALILYPMNALVSDQLGRLRKMLGDREGRFSDVFHSSAGNTNARRPQFGMYTGRTPYPGDVPDPTYSKKLADTLERTLLNCGNTEAERKLIIDKLISIGKYPSKRDLRGFIESLKKNNHITDPQDAELLTRFEIQRNCPDILITNYSMLEYTLLRPVEDSIWSDTKEWLNASKDNKLLLIIDEAHMYRGASGGEVALLIRRLLNKLEVNRDRVQFILTTASIPSAKDEMVIGFANTLCAQDPAKNNFVLVRGETEPILFDGAVETDTHAICGVNIDLFMQDEESKLAEIKRFGELAGFSTEGCDFHDAVAVQQWLYDALLKCGPLLRMMSCCRGKATKMQALADVAFPNDDEETGLKAASVLLAIAPFAKNKKNQVLFPARLHLLFRGLRGIYACSNPTCYKATEAEKKLGIGKVYLTQQRKVCECGGNIYELTNDRACGALFIKGYIDKAEDGNYYVWESRGVDEDRTIKEVYFYIIGENGFDKKDKKTNKTAWLNSISGRLDFSDENANKPNYLHVAFYDKEDEKQPGILLFSVCPHCNKRNLRVTDFSTKGSEPFFNQVSEQLRVQPQTIFDPAMLENSPNKGRKVLLFSDSRQKAATLAKDLSRAADEDAMKKALPLAAKKLQEWASQENGTPSMDLLYIVFLHIAYDYKLKFFEGDDENVFRRQVEEMGRKLNISKKLKIKLDYKAFASSFSPPELYQYHLLKQMCHWYRSLSDVGLCWIEPCDQFTSLEVIETLQDGNVDMDFSRFVELFSAWCYESRTSADALGSDVPDGIRERLSGENGRFGLQNGDEIPTTIKNLLKQHGNYSDEQINVIRNALLKYTEENGKKGRNLNMRLITLKYNAEEHTWYKCPRCGGIFAFTLYGKCIHCGKADALPMHESDFDGVQFWRNPVLKAIHGDQQSLVTNINAEEHTAQLSHKDQRNDMWSTTEDFEMRFQNVSIGNERPVDVLSCTTTMEVGIDIGSLTAVGLRNIPPARENYQQRAGRAGRKSASISTIVTYTDNGPHDNYYYDHPEEMISGDPRIPWIDGQNKKLICRHLYIVLLTEYLRTLGLGIDSIGAKSFFNDHYSSYVSYVSGRKLTPDEQIRLIPEEMISIVGDFKPQLISELDSIREKVVNHPDDYVEYHNGVPKEDSLLDVLYLESYLPTYSFPKNVVGFHIEDDDGKSIKQLPDRSLDIAISEYAPGRTIVVNKQTYRSGGIYSFHAKILSGVNDNPARRYIGNYGKEYLRKLYMCQENSCKWFGTSQPQNDECPFCRSHVILTKDMVKPWGFAPLNGTRIRESDKGEPTYAESPCYSATPDDRDMASSMIYTNVRVAKRQDQPLIITNMGPREKGENCGFTICRDCGAAVSGDDEQELRKINKPYINPRNKGRCSHRNVLAGAYLGHEFKTDMVVFELSLEKKLVNTEYGNAWVKVAAVTLSEAMVLCAGRMLDIEYTEIKSGYRTRETSDITYLDIFLFDSLSSGAGYCAEIALRSDELLDKTKAFLGTCVCDTACNKCLNHFWNQRVQSNLNRHKAIELLDWSKNGVLRAPYSFEEMKKIAKPLITLFDTNHDYSLAVTNSGLWLEHRGEKREVYICPNMWKEDNASIHKDAIVVSDYLIQFSLPKAYSLLIKRFTESPTPSRKRERVIFEFMNDGRNPGDDSYEDIWNDLSDDVTSDQSLDREIIKTLIKLTPASFSGEKPVYGAHMRKVQSSETISTNLVWPKNRIVLFLSEKCEEYKKAKNSDWKCFCFSDGFNAIAFINEIKEL